MATKFLEPGGDADFLVGTTNGFWGVIGAGGATIVNDFVHGNHQKSIKLVNNSSYVTSKNNIVNDSGTRFSYYLYINQLPVSTTSIFLTIATGFKFTIRITSAGVLQLWNGTANQVGTDGATLSTGVWYRISLAYTITSTTVNEFRLFVNGISSISITNTTITNIGGTTFRLGNETTGANVDMRVSDIYVDDSNSLTDTGDIWVTAKRPVSNGTTNGFTTQIGSGGSGYGSGHSPQVNERALSLTNGWSMVGAGSAVTEEYNIEGKSVGDIDISTATIVDWLGWVSIKALAAQTGNVIIDGSSVAQAITTTTSIFTKIKGSTTYPSGTGADIGYTTTTALTTVSLYECGIVVAYIPGVNAGPVNLKSYNTNLKANIKSINTNLIANVKSLNTNV